MRNKGSRGKKRPPDSSSDAGLNPLTDVALWIKRQHVELKTRVRVPVPERIFLRSTFRSSYVNAEFLHGNIIRTSIGQELRDAAIVAVYVVAGASGTSGKLIASNANYSSMQLRPKTTNFLLAKLLQVRIHTREVVASSWSRDGKVDTKVDGSSTQICLTAKLQLNCLDHITRGKLKKSRLAPST
ncbi:hypothetical protein ANN_01928 [Periplaneta americana]|uniref:Uncharacterized protein n=1 Tax=Periplaneta americana TaxID=6978 RepID=A0ABQ8TWI1_PERAM|nr:hypothetical protein ANN_01928 [Periplaneta americana]